MRMRTPSASRSTTSARSGRRHAYWTPNINATVPSSATTISQLGQAIVSTVSTKSTAASTTASGVPNTSSARQARWRAVADTSTGIPFDAPKSVFRKMRRGANSAMPQPPLQRGPSNATLGFPPTTSTTPRQVRRARSVAIVLALLTAALGKPRPRRGARSPRALRRPRSLDDRHRRQPPNGSILRCPRCAKPRCRHQFPAWLL